MSDQPELVLPAFELDCREWMVVSPTDAGLPDDVAGAPLLAVLSTMVIDDDIREATGALTVGVIDEHEPLALRPLAPGCVAHELLDADPAPATEHTRRYVMPTPAIGSDGSRLALLAEFVIAEAADFELERRVESLMLSFRWQAA